MRPRLWPFWFSLLYAVSLSKVGAQNSTTCSGTIVLNATKELQYLTTPNFETNYNYPPLLDCKFLIKAPDKSRIFVNLIDMELEPRIFEECSDYVGFFDEVKEKNTSITNNVCQDTKNRQFISTSNEFTITFHTDERYESRGARLSYQYYDFTICPPDWIELANNKCVKLETDKKLDWISAQERCMDQQSNLVVLESKQKADEIHSKFKIVPSKVWIGHNDALTESKFVDHQNSDLTFNDGIYSIVDNNEDNDCMTFQFVESDLLRMDSCANYNGFICEMKKDGSSELYPPPILEIQEGAYTHTSQYTLWLLLFLIGILFLTIMAFLCFMCWKQKEGGRVHTESATIQQNAFMNDSAHRAEQPASGQNAIPVSNDVNRTSRSSPLTLPIENNRPPPKKFPMAPVPNRLPMSEEISGSEPVVETGILGGDPDIESVSAVPKPQPRTLPPMPTREGTFHSINTREGSTVRTRRNREMFERPVMNVLDNVSAISLDEFWSNKKP